MELFYSGMKSTLLLILQLSPSKNFIFLRIVITFTHHTLSYLLNEEI